MMHHGDQLAIPYGDTYRHDPDQLTVWDYDGTCTWWMGSQAAPCGNPTTTDLCPRHEAVRQQQLEAGGL